MPTDTITISKEDLKETASKIIAENSIISDLCKGNFALGLAFILFAAELGKELFKDEKEDNE